MGSGESPWALYDALIEDIPEEVLVKDYAFGEHWSYVLAECGMGVAYSVRGGALKGSIENFRGKSLRHLAEEARSWCFEDATLGVAAINAWYARRELLEPLGATFDRPASSPEGRVRAEGFSQYRDAIKSSYDAGRPAKVAVVGHFPFTDGLAEFSDLTVLERNPRSPLDTPDPACEYIVPDQDYLFLTGITVTNKTAPRLLSLARAATVVMLGPSTVMSPKLFGFGVDMLAGSIVADPEKAAWACKGGANQTFAGGLQKCSLTAQAYGHA